MFSTKKMLVALAMAAALTPMPAFAACASNTNDSSSTPVEMTGTISGGWQINDDQTSGWATEEANAAFKKATEGLVGASYKNLGLLATQVVAGTNYAFLCRKTLVTSEPITNLCVITVYEDLSGNAKITSVKDFNLGDHGNEEGADQTGDPVVGSWAQPDHFKSVNLPAPVAQAYTEALGNTVGYYPAAYLGSQVVSGTNYAVLCYTQSDGTHDWMGKIPCVVYLYKPTQGPAVLTSVYALSAEDFTE